MSKWFGGEDAAFCKLNCKIKKYFYKDIEQNKHSSQNQRDGNFMV